MELGLVRNGHIYNILEEGSTNFLTSLTGNVRRVMVGVRVLAQNIKPSSYRAEEQVGRRGQESGKHSGLVYYLRFFLDSLAYPWLVWNALYLETTQLVLGPRGCTATR